MSDLSIVTSCCISRSRDSSNSCLSTSKDLIWSDNFCTCSAVFSELAITAFRSVISFSFKDCSDLYASVAAEVFFSFNDCSDVYALVASESNVSRSSMRFIAISFSVESIVFSSLYPAID